MNPLHGKTILITRPKEQAAKFEMLLNSTGAKSIHFSTVEIVPPLSWEECDDAIKNTTSYDGIIFTSVNAVEYFFKRCKERNVNEPDIPVYVVGEKTYETAARYGVTAIVPSSVQDSKHLVEILLSLGGNGKRFLFPKGDRSKTTITKALQQAGAEVDELIVYRTIIPPHADIQQVKEKLLNKTIDIVTFFSGSSVDNFTELIPPQVLSSVVIAVNGNSAANAVKRAGLTPNIIADHPTMESMVEAMEKFYSGD